MRFEPKGLTLNLEGQATPGFTIFSPLYSHDTYLIGLDGEIVHQWRHADRIGTYGHLLPNGNLLSSLDGGTTPEGILPRGGIIRETDWDGNMVWEHLDDLHHHDMRRLPNGNTVYLAWELLSGENAPRVLGGVPESEHENGIYGEVVREVSPDGDLVWEWRAQEHLAIEDWPIPPVLPRAEWGHANAVVPVGEDGYLVGFRDFNLLAVIDKKTNGLSWRLRNPDWGLPHDPHFLDNGNVMLFANRAGQMPLGSKVLEMSPDDGSVIWEYSARPHHAFSSPFISGAQRLASGNTLICEGLWGCIFEVTPGGEIVWEYVNPFTAEWDEGPLLGPVGALFRACRYAEDSPEINGCAAA